MPRVDAIVPARNESDTVAGVVRALLRANCFQRIIVVDNGSTDDTALRARIAGAEVVSCPDEGLGRAVKSGAAISTAEFIFEQTPILPIGSRRGRSEWSPGCVRA